MEQKKLEKKMRFLLALVAGAFLVLVVRLSFLQLVEVAKYQTQAQANHQRLIPIAPPRGDIIDRNGERIVGNRPVYTVSVTYLGLKDTDRIVDALANLLVGEKMYEGMGVEQIKARIQEKMQAEKLRLYEPVHVAAGVSLEAVARIEEHRLDLPGVIIDVEPVRDYPYGDLLAPVLGYVGEIEKDQLEKNRDKGYQMGDSFGKTGLENQYEEFLRGKRGARLVEVDALGRPVRDVGVKAPTPGNNLVLAIDGRLQRAAQDALAKGIASARTVGGAKITKDKTLSAAAVVLDVRTGEVLTMASLPSYDPAVFARGVTKKEYQELTKTGALRNHAIETTYIPGSTFKMVTATALLEGGIVKPDTVISDPGYYKTQKDWKPGGHGRVDIRRALKVSCDTFFYMFGAQAGPELMGKYAKEYGLGEKTGIDLPGEEAGLVPSREHKKEIWRDHPWESQWHEYDSTNMAIGQGENKYTALQLANYMAAIANGGKLYRPHIVKKIISPDGKTVASFAPQIVRRLEVSSETIKIIQEGVHLVTLPPDGTAAGVFAGAGYQAAAKTGTAEVGDAAGNKHALFLAYAPYENPEVAVSVIIEYGGMGSGIAGPVAREILDAYFLLENNPEAKSLEEAKEKAAQEEERQADSTTQASGAAARRQQVQQQTEPPGRPGPSPPGERQPQGPAGQGPSARQPAERPPEQPGQEGPAAHRQERPTSPAAPVEERRPLIPPAPPR
ncbi:MAG: penicillin-binding protein 2 [Bacillota bacterium]